MENKKEIIIYADGFMASKKEKQAGYSIAVFLDNKKIYYDKKYLSEVSKKYRHYFAEAPQTNNTFEYLALFSAILLCKKLIHIYSIKEYDYYIYMDSEVIIKQFKGDYKVNVQHLKRINKLCLNHFNNIHHNSKVKINWIKRKKIVEILGH